MIENTYSEEDSVCLEAQCIERNVSSPNMSVSSPNMSVSSLSMSVSNLSFIYGVQDTHPSVTKCLEPQYACLEPQYACLEPKFECVEYSASRHAVFFPKCTFNLFFPDSFLKITNLNY